MTNFRLNNQNLSKRNGFTLVELMVAITIIIISSAAAYIMFEQGSILIEEQYHRRIAFEKAQAFYEEVKAYRESHGGAFPPTMPAYFDAALVPGSSDGSNDGIIARYTVQIVRSQVSHPLFGGTTLFAEIRINYKWVEHSGREYSYQFNTPI